MRSNRNQTSQDVGPLFEECALCHTLHPSGEMVEIYVRGRKDEPVPVRLCQRCAAPHLTYIAGRWRIGRIDVPRLLGLMFGLTVAVLNILLGRLVPGDLGLFIALAGILAGAGISVAFAVSIAMPQGGGETAQ